MTPIAENYLKEAATAAKGRREMGQKAITQEFCAAHLGVKPATIRSYFHRGLLTQHCIMGQKNKVLLDEKFKKLCARKGVATECDFTILVKDSITPVEKTATKTVASTATKRIEMASDQERIAHFGEDIATIEQAAKESGLTKDEIEIGVRLHNMGFYPSTSSLYMFSIRNCKQFAKKVNDFKNLYGERYKTFLEMDSSTYSAVSSLINHLRREVARLRSTSSEQLLKIAANDVAKYREQASRTLCENSNLRSINKAYQAKIDRLTEEKEIAKSQQVIVEFESEKPTPIIPAKLHSDMEKELAEKSAMIERLESLVKQQNKEFDNLAKKHEAAKRKISRLEENTPSPEDTRTLREIAKQFEVCKDFDGHSRLVWSKVEGTFVSEISDDLERRIAKSLPDKYRKEYFAKEEQPKKEAKKSHYAQECEVEEINDVILADAPLFDTAEEKPFDRETFRIPTKTFDPSTIVRCGNG